MLQKKTKKEYARKIQFSNGTYYVTLPMKFVRLFGWKERQEVVVQPQGKKKMVITDLTSQHRKKEKGSPKMGTSSRKKHH